MKAPSLSEKALCFRQLASFMEAGIPLHTAFTLLQATHPRLHARFASIANELHQGVPLSQAAKQQPALFSPFAIELIHLGESSGQLDACLLTLANTTETEHTTRLQLKQTLTYPVVLFVVSTLMLFTLFYAVIPRFAELYAARTASLPALTRGLFWMAAHFHQAGLTFFLICLIGLAVRVWYLGDRPVLSTLPGLRTFWVRANVLRFLHGLSLALNAGIPLDASLRLGSQLCRDPLLHHTIHEVRTLLHSGLPLHQAMKRHPVFPPLLTSLIQTGETTGRLDTLLMQAHHQLNESFKHHLHQCVSLMEPLILLIQGALIGSIVIGLYLPIFNLGTLL